MEQFTYKVLADEISQVEESLRMTAANFPSELKQGVWPTLHKELDSLLTRTNLHIAVVGQYSSGKSTIISALTGVKDIPIGQDVTTDKACVYRWGGHELVDTPGIYAGRPDHDAISLRHMDQADLLVFVTTVNGFDNIIGDHFQKLALGEYRIAKMMLVINKIGTEPESNRKNTIHHVEEVISPIDPKDVFLSAIDAKEYLEALEEPDPSIRQQLFGLSAFESFVAQLNAFVKARELRGRLLAPLNTICSSVSILTNALLADSEDVTKTQEALRQKRFIIADSKRRCLMDVRSEISNLTTAIAMKGSEVASRIVDDVDVEEITFANSSAIADVDVLCDNATSGIENVVTKELHDLEDKIGTFMSSQLVLDLEQITRTRLIAFDVSVEDARISDRTKKMSRVVSNLGDILHKQATASKVVRGRLPSAGSNLHEAILKLGKMVNFKFKPYQAAKIAEKFGKFGKGLGIAGGLLGPAIAILEEVREGQYKESLKQARLTVRRQYHEYSQVISAELNSEIAEKLEGFYNSVISNIDEDAESLRNQSGAKEAAVAELADIQARAQVLQSRVKGL